MSFPGRPTPWVARTTRGSIGCGVPRERGPSARRGRGGALRPLPAATPSPPPPSPSPEPGARARRPGLPPELSCLCPESIVRARRPNPLPEPAARAARARRRPGGPPEGRSVPATVRMPRIGPGGRAGPPPEKRGWRARQGRGNPHSRGGEAGQGCPRGRGGAGQGYARGRTGGDRAARIAGRRAHPDPGGLKENVTPGIDGKSLSHHRRLKELPSAAGAPQKVFIGEVGVRMV